MTARRRRRQSGGRADLAIAVIATLSAPLGVVAAPLTFNTALPVATDEFVFRGQVVVNRSGDDPSGTNRDRTVSSGVSAHGYGVTGRLALIGVLPYVDKELQLDGPGGRIVREASGAGDLSLFARYTLFRRDWTGRTFRVAPFAGIELPTGEDDERDALGSVPAPLQPGSGALDRFGGVVATYQTLDYQLDAQLVYRCNGEANGFRAGAEWGLASSLQFRLWPRRLGAGVPGFLYGVLEAGLAQRSENEAGGARDPDSGGSTPTLTPALQYVTKRWILEGGVGVPVVQNLNGRALETDYVVRAGFRVNF